MPMDYRSDKKIFIVDDDVLYLTMLQDFLKEQFSYQTEVFKTGEDCLKSLHMHPDIVILDYNLNSVSEEAANGMEILKTIKKTSPNTKIIMLSSQESYGVALQTVQKGAVQYIIKDKSAFEKIAALIEGF